MGAPAPPPTVDASPSSAPETTGPRRIESAEAPPVDLLEMAGAPLTKRLLPIAVGVLVVFVLWRVLRRR
ncbi:MAG: hypothetical protein ACT4OX_12035 [Actinomycetota bacterium]